MHDDDEQADPLELIARFSRCKNYPFDRAGLQYLAQGLAASSRHTGVSMEDIVEACATRSERCPTDAEMLATAKEIKLQRSAAAESVRSKESEWRKQYGAPQAYDWQAEANRIMAASPDHWEKRRQLIRLTHSKCGGKEPNKISNGEWLVAQIEAQRELGMPVTPEQERELRRVNG